MRATCEELSVEHVDRLVVPGVLTLQVDGVQEVLDEGGQDHGEQDGVLAETHRQQAQTFRVAFRTEPGSTAEAPSEA